MKDKNGVEVRLGDFVLLAPPAYAERARQEHFAAHAKPGLAYSRPDWLGRVIGRVASLKTKDEEGYLLEGQIRVGFMALATGSAAEENVPAGQVEVVLRADGADVG